MPPQIRVRPSRNTARVIARFVSGRELNGTARTNARWKHPGLEPRNDYEWTTWWTRQSYRRRAGIRLGAVAWLGVHLVALAIDWSTTVVTLRVQFWLAVALVAWVVVYRYRKYAHREGVIVPVGQVVAEWLGYDRHVDPLNLVKVPMGYRTNPDKPIEISLPKHYAEPPRRQLQLASHVAARGGIRSHDYEVLLEGEAPKMLVRAQLVPPDEVMWADDDELREIVMSCWDDSVLCLGRGLHGAPVWVDFKRDSPHIALSWGSGAGKTALLRFLAAQTVYKGGRAAIFDGGKDGESHQDWTRDEAMQLVDGVEFYPTIAEEHDALVAWENERQRRSQAVLARTGEQFQRVLLVLEERNVTKARLQAYWTSIREKDEPLKSPAVQAIANLVNAGRSVNMNCAASAQRFDAYCIGGGDVRGSFQLRSLARFDEQGRKMLIPDITPKPKSSSHPGRAILVVNGEVIEYQAAFLTPGETVGLCRSGVEQTDRRIIAPRPKTPALHGSLGERPVLGHPRPTAIEQAPPVIPAADDALMTIKQAVDEGVLSCSLDTARKAAVRAAKGEGRFAAVRDEGPHGAHLYAASDLAAWDSARGKVSV